MKRTEAAVDHAEVEHDHLAQLYVLGKLSPAETTRFEEHYLDCPECLERLRQAESLHRGLRGLVARGEVEDFRPDRPRRLAAAAPLRLLAAGLFLAALLPAAYLAWQNRRLTAELAAARAAVETTSAVPATATPTAAAEHAAEVDRLTRELTAARQELGRLDALLGQSRAPQPGTVLAFLGAVREAGGATPPTAEVRLAAHVSWVVLVLDLGAPEGARHRVQLSRGGERRPLWAGRDIAAGADGQVTLAVPAAMLPPGDYELRAEPTAPAAAGRDFPFRVVPAR
jgi:hypothetical protein